jgi:hypothetical protein
MHACMPLCMYACMHAARNLLRASWAFPKQELSQLSQEEAVAEMGGRREAQFVHQAMLHDIGNVLCTLLICTC